MRLNQLSMILNATKDIRDSMGELREAGG